MKNNDLAQKLNLLLFSCKYNLIDLNNETKNPFESLLSECSEEEKTEIIAIEMPNIVNFYYLFQQKIDKILYDKDDTINFDSRNFKTSLSNYFYLVLLIESNYEIINYTYNFQLIDNLNKIMKKGEFYYPIYANIIFKLIKNIENSEEEIEEYEESLNKIKNDLIAKLDNKKTQTKLQECKLDYSSKNINNIPLEEVYINIIINVLLKLYLTDTKYEKETKKFIEEIDLENIELTRAMLNKIVEFFNEEEKNKYIISEVKDFEDEKKLNFYYYFFKYILKKNYYIYQIKFLKELKEKIKNILIAQNELNNSRIKFEKLKYIIEFFTDNDKIIKLPQEQVIFERNDYSMNSNQSRSVSVPDSSKNIYGNEKDNDQNYGTSQIQQLSTIVTTAKRSEISYDYEKDLSFSNEENNYELLHFKKYIMKFKNIKSKQVLELGNHHFLKTDFRNNIYVYDENYNYLNELVNDNYIQKINNINDENSFVIIQTDLFKYASSNKRNLNDVVTYENTYKSNQLFEINSKGKKEYLISGKEGLYRSESLKKENNTIEEISKENLLDGIKITDSLYAFYSNEKFTEGKNIILIYDTEKNQSEDNINNNPKSINEFKNSNGKNTYPSFNNPFYVINVNDNYKILLCACRGYCSNNVNGILITKIETKIKANGFKTKSQNLFDTEDFEVSCFCTIYENKEKKYSYILVGGLETDKRRGMIKLYKFSYNNYDDPVKIEFIQDAIEDFDQFQDFDFDGRINKIFIPKGKKRDVIVQCFGGSCYLFNLPKDDNYIERYENLF